MDEFANLLLVGFGIFRVLERFFRGKKLGTSTLLLGAVFWILVYQPAYSIRRHGPIL